jgi:hypothetical protein
MEKLPGPQLLARPASRNTLHLKLICLHAPADQRPVARPWPRQMVWQDFPRLLGKPGLRPA